MPTVYDYTTSLGASPSFFGLLLASFSITRMVVFVPIGWWADRRPFGEVFAATAAVGFVGCFIYGAAGAMGDKWYLIVGRVLTGFGASNTTLSRTYISRCVEADEFTRILGIQMTLDLFGVIVGPALIAVIRNINFDVGWFHFNEQTAPGYIMAVLQLIMLFCWLFNFTEPPPQTRRKSIRRRSLEEVDGEEAAKAAGASSWGAIWRVLITGGGWFFVLTTFTVNFNLCALETVATPLMEDHFGWGSLENSGFFAGCAAVGVVGMYTGMKMPRTSPMVLGIFCMIASFVIWILQDGGSDLPMAPFLVGSVFCIFGLCCLTPANSSYFTQIVEYQGGAQGVFGGIWSVFMSAGKSLGPIVAGVALNYLDDGYGNWIIFVMCVPVLAVNALALPFIFGVTNKLDAATEFLKEERESNTSDLGKSLLEDFAADEESQR